MRNQIYRDKIIQNAHTITSPADPAALPLVGNPIELTQALLQDKGQVFGIKAFILSLGTFTPATPEVRKDVKIVVKNNANPQVTLTDTTIGILPKMGSYIIVTLPELFRDETISVYMRAGGGLEGQVVFQVTLESI